MSAEANFISETLTPAGNAEAEIYTYIRTALEEAHGPITTAELMDCPRLRVKVRELYRNNDASYLHARVSDKLALMWRRGQLDRFTAHHVPITRGVRYAYCLPGRFDNYGMKLLPPVKLGRRHNHRTVAVEEVVGSDPVQTEGHQMRIYERGDDVVIQLKKLRIVIGQPLDD